MKNMSIKYLIRIGGALALACATAQAEEINLLIFGNSYSHFFDYLPQIAESQGDNICVVAMRNSNSVHEMLAAEEKIASGELEAITAEEARTMSKKEYSQYGFTPLESDYKARVRMKMMLDSKKWDYISIQPHSSWANDQKRTASIVEPVHAYLKKNYPDSQLVLYHTTQYRNDDLLFKVTPNKGVYRRVRDDVPYTEDLHYLDALQAHSALAEELGIDLCPGSTAMENARYDVRWAEVAIDPDFDYFHAEPPAEPDNQNSLHLGFHWRKGWNPKYKWISDSHPNSCLNYLTACVWYELLFKKSCVGADVPDETSFTRKKGLALQQIAHETVNGKLPPLRLISPEAREQYGDILLERARQLSSASDSEKQALAASCYQNVMVFIPEHQGVREAEAYLKSCGQLKTAKVLADREAEERPVREARYQLIWEASGKTSTVDNKKLGRWDDL